MSLRPEKLAVARWEPLAGDPSAAERGRWVVESPTVRCLGILDAEQDDVDRVAELLRELLAGDGHEVEAVGISLDHEVTAFGPPPGREQLLADVAAEVSRDSSTTGTTSDPEGSPAVTTPAGAGRGSRAHGVSAAPETSSGSSGQEQGPEDGSGAHEGVRPVVGAGGTDAARPHPADSRPSDTAGEPSHVTLTSGDGEGSGAHQGVRPTPTLHRAMSCTSVADLVEALTVLRGRLAALGDAEISETWMSISLQVCTGRGAAASARLDTVQLLVGALGHSERATWDDAQQGWYGTSNQPIEAGLGSVSVYGARLGEVMPLSELPLCGPVPPRVGVPWSMTPRRRTLLAAIAAGEVYAESGQAWSTATGNKVSARVVEALAAEWVVEGRLVATGKRTYVLTDAGRDAAAAWDKAQGGDDRG